MEPFSLYIFGVTGNLSQIKILPSLYDLFARKIVPTGSKIYGIGRKSLSHEEFLAYVHGVISKPIRHHEHEIDNEIWKKMANHIEYVQGEFDTDLLYQALARHKHKNKIFYLATPPDLYEIIFTNLKANGLSTSTGWVRLLLEKPIGTDLTSAKKLNKLLNKYFKDEQVFRLDHYLGKETLQNILTFRFGNGLLEPLMHKEYISNIQITAAEDFGIGERGGYYDSVGALKDVGQNHLLQMLTAVTMEAPNEFTNAAVTKERIKVLEKLVPKPKKVFFGQYEGYLGEPKVDPKSKTDTFFSMECELNNDRFRGVPIYLRAGKKLEQTVTEIAVIFKNSSNRLFSHLEKGQDPNALIFRIQPNEGIVLSIVTKLPGHEFRLDNTYMEYCYRQHGELPDAYERLLVDAIKGDQTFFNDPPEVELQWLFIENLSSKSKKPTIYKPGSWGPKDPFPWLTPSPIFCAR